jgi:hypothetical protein
VEFSLEKEQAGEREQKFCLIIAFELTVFPLTRHPGHGRYVGEYCQNQNQQTRDH